MKLFAFPCLSRRVHAVLLIAFLAIPCPTLAQERPIVVAFRVAVSPEMARREARFITELSLAMDRFEVLPFDVDGSAFSSMVLAERLNEIRTVTDTKHAVATVWIEQMGNDTLLLNLVAVSTGRVLVRIVEIETGPSSEAELAFAAQELIGEAYLFSPTPLAPAVEETVDELRRTVIAPGNEVSSRALRLGILPRFELSGAIFERNGPSLVLGGGLALNLPLPRRLFVRVAVSGEAGPRDRPADGVVSGFGVVSGLGLGYRFDLGRFSVGPLIGAAVSWHRMDMVLGDGDNETFSTVRPRIDADADLRLALKDAVSLVLDIGLFVYPVSETYRRLSDESVVLKTPVLSWHIGIGTMVDF